MGVRLDALPDYLVRWRVPFTLIDGWQTRSRSSGDFVDVMGIGVHHTASKTTVARDLGWEYTNAPDRPIGNGLLDRTGHWHLGSVRATNTQGKGGPFLTSRGTIPLNSGNSRIFSIEAANDGVGEPWPNPQIDTYLNLCAALIDCVSETTPGPPLTEGDILAHFEWARGRKFDPAGESPYASGRGLWRMDEMRRDVYVRRHPPIATPTIPITPPDEEDDMPKAHIIRASDGTAQQQQAWFILSPDQIAWCRTLKQFALGKAFGWYINTGDEADAVYTAVEIQQMIDAFLVDGGAVPPGFRAPA